MIPLTAAPEHSKARTSRCGHPANAVRLYVGLFLLVFAIVGLSGPGRIDIVDGQARYEVSRSLVDHHDEVIRNDQVWFGVFPGRDGRRYTSYRFPQSVLGVPAVILADFTGPKSEERRHFFFVLTSAVCAGLLAVAYGAWFRHRGLSHARTVLWAAAGIFCTPAWFYGTSTYDDIVGALFVVAALVIAGLPQDSKRTGTALWSGLLLGVAFNCKQPLGAFGLAAVIAMDRASLTRNERIGRACTLAAGLTAGIFVYAVYDWYKFPPETKSLSAPLLAQYFPVWPGHPVLALAALTISPGAGAVWYCPPVVLGASGLWSHRTQAPAYMWAVCASLAIFVGFIASMSIFKGDPSWGPRYLTPVFAVLWLFAPDGVPRWGRKDTRTLLVLGCLVQVAALTVDPHRLYVERGLPSAFGAVAPALYFYPPVAHLLNRPREIAEVWRARHDPGERFSPSLVPTFAFPIIDRTDRGPAAVAKYKLLNSFRPWWVSHWYIPPASRPVSITRTVAVMVSIAALGLLLLVYPRHADVVRRPA